MVNRSINNFRIVLVVTLFILLGIGIVSAADRWTFSSNNAQFSSAEKYRGFSQEQASTYWPALSDSDSCEATSDFLMNIRPGSCTPNVVRSDLLEEQNVPVFCKVDIIKLNPLIDVSLIKSVKFDKGPSDFVSSVTFHPNREAIYSHKDYLDNPLINDAGYVVVVLKRIEREADMPDYVKLNLTGVLRYDAEGMFGSGRSSYYLESVNDEEWNTGDRYVEDSFFKGNGYLRMDWVRDNQAGVSVYRDKDTKIGSFVLEKGKESRILYIPGFYCKAGVKLNLQNIQAGVTKVQLEVDGERIWLTEGEKFSDNDCVVSKINIQPINEKEKIVRYKHSVMISCKGKSKTLEYEVKISDEEVSEGEEKNELVNTGNIDEALSENFKQAEEYAKDIEAYYGAVGENKEIWAAKALFQLGVLADKIGYNKSAEDIFLRLIRDYPDTAYATSAGMKIRTIGNPSVGYEGVEIKLVKVETPSYEDSSAVFEISPKENHGLKVDGEDESFLRINGNVLEMKPNTEMKMVDSGDKIFVKELNDGEVKVTRYYVEDKKNKQEELVLTRGESFVFVQKDEDNPAVTLTLSDIRVNEIAKVEIISYTPSEQSEADFSFGVGIEKRGIQLSPEKTNDMIENLNKSIKEFEDRVEALGKGVKVMKAACLATSSVLLIKNFFANLEGGATARQKVMPIWYKKCETESAGDKNAFNKCLKDNAVDIENDIKKYRENIEEVNADLIKVQNENLYPRGEAVNRKAATEAFRFENFGSDGLSYTSYEFDDGVVKEILSEISKDELSLASLTDLRELELNKRVLASQSGENLEQVARVKIDEIAKRLKQKASLDIKGDLYSLKEGDNWLNVVRTQYYSGGEYDGSVYRVPLPGTYEDKSGFYVIVEESGPGKVGGYIGKTRELKEFRIQNIGDDGILDVEGDSKIYVPVSDKSDIGSVLDMGDSVSKKIISDSIQAVKIANGNSGKDRFSLFGNELLVDTVGAIDEKRCQDFMSPDDCLWLFNLCDPVLCPSSRCDLGGTYRVDNVIQSGIIGSIALCLPNFNEGVFIPVCLSGIHAGLEAYTSILRGHRDCLQDSLETGRMMGICDETYSIYACDFFWRQAAPFADNFLLNVVEGMHGQGMRGGGEYLTIQDSWDSTSDSIDFLRDDYAVNAVNSFNVRSTADIGSPVCKAFIGTSYPDGASFFDNLVEPDSPVQFNAWFDEIPYTDATVPPTSQYKVFYHIYAGKDVGTNYQVYLKSPAESAYVAVQDVIVVDTGYVPIGGYASEADDFTAPAGYRQLCVRINGKDECGFGKVSTSFAVDWLSDKYYEEQLSKKDIVTKEECTSGSPSAWSLAQPNIQAGVESMVNPDLNKKGVVRICSSDNPGKAKDKYRWEPVGYCDNEDVKCWLDKQSVKDVIKNKNISAGIIQDIGQISSSVDVLDVLDDETVKVILTKADNFVKGLEKELDGKSVLEMSNVIKTKQGEVGLIIVDLEKVENKGATNSLKAEAVYNKFRIYYVIANSLASLRNVMVVEGEKKAEDEAKSDATSKNNVVGNIWTLDSAIEEVKTFQRNDKYSKHKEFIDKIYGEGIINNKEYVEINGGDILDLNREEDMGFVLELLLKKKKEIDCPVKFYKGKELLKAGSDQRLDKEFMDNFNIKIIGKCPDDYKLKLNFDNFPPIFEKGLGEIDSPMGVDLQNLGFKTGKLYFKIHDNSNEVISFSYINLQGIDESDRETLAIPVYKP